MDHRFAVDVLEICQDTRLKFGLGGDPDVAKHGSRHLREEAFH
jgi:hypothetical protein